jgi:hypothetical protein
MKGLLMPDQKRMILLKTLYLYIRGIPKEKELLSVLSDKKEYVSKCKNLIGSIDRCKGFYLWGTYDKRGLWTNMYLGKASSGKIANLRSRILEELIDERMCFLKIRYSEKELKEAGRELHGEMWRKYEKHANRAFLKYGSTHIAWVSTGHLSNNVMLLVEADLIEAMNPKANLIRPKPPAYLQPDTRDIFEQFRASIHEGRNTKYTA